MLMRFRKQQVRVPSSWSVSQRSMSAKEKTEFDAIQRLLRAYCGWHGKLNVLKTPEKA